MTIRESSNQLYLILLSCIAALGGLLFGFDTAVISGTIGYFKPEFNLSPAMVGWVVSSTLVGCLIGSTITGYLCDKYGRKPVLIISAIFFVISSGLAIIVQSASGLVILRFLGGIGIGIASVGSPLYITEIAPSAIRGRLTSLQQLAIVSGILAAFYSNNLFSGSSLPDNEKWRFMIGVGVIPSLIFLFLLLLVPESPRWFVKREKIEKARRILSQINGEKIAEKEIISIQESMTIEKGTLKELLKPGIRRALIIGMALGFFSQVTGINAIMYYAPEIFKSAGIANSMAYSDTVWVGFINLFFTILAMILVDKLGRRPLLLIGFMVMSLSLVMISTAFYRNISGIPILIGILLFVASFSMSVGVVSWVVFSEIFPNKIRGRAVSLVTGIVWGVCFMVSQTFPILSENIGSSMLFLIYAFFCALGFLFVLKMLPETKQKTLEEIEKSW